MNVTTTKTGDLTATLRVEIKEADYQQKVADKLKDYKKKANIPGFRPGHVPAGLIKKQYGKPLLIDEVNQMLQRAVYEHIQKESLEILGNPLPVEQTDIDWDNQKDFSFDFELGLSPEFSVEVSDKTKVPYLVIEADKAMIDRYVEDYAKRFGKMSYPTKVEEHAILKGAMVEVDAAGTPVEGGIEKSVTLTMSSLAKEKEAMGKQVGDTLALNAKKSFAKDFNLANVLGVSAQELEESTGEFTFTLSELSKLEPAPVNQELFDKVFGEGAVKSEAEFRDMIKADAEKMFVGESDRKFYEDLKKTVLEKTKVGLPVAFLKKWMQTAGEKPMTADEVETQFPQMEESMKWQLVENKVIKDHKIEVKQEELIAFTQDLVARQMAQYGQSPEPAELENIAKRVLENQEEAQRIADQLFSEKLVGFFKNAVSLKEKKVSFDDFLKEMTDK
jgi:trigger factor